MLERNETIIKQKLKKYLLPGIMLTAALQIGNIVDSMLVGSLLGPKEMSAVKIGMAIDNIVELPGYVLGVGGSIAAGMYLGKREIEKAKKVFSITFFLSVLCGFIFSISSIGSSTYAEWLCGGSALVEDTKRFVFVTLLLAPVLNISLQMINYVAVDNNPSVASIYVITANVLNLALDYILLKFTSLGTAGAALSTCLGYGLAWLVLIAYMRSKKRMLGFVNPFGKAGLKEIMGVVFKASIPTLLYMVFLTVKDMTLNTMIVKLVGETAIVIYTVCCNSALCVQLLAGGIIELMSSMGSVLYGERDYFGIRSLIKYVIRYSYIVLAFFIVLMVFKADIFLGMFGVKDAEVVPLAVTALRIYTLSLPFFLWNKFMVLFYQSTDKVTLSSIATSLQTCVAVVPLAYAFIMVAKAIGADSLNALIYSFVASEVVTTFATLIFKKLKYKEKGIFMLPKGNSEGKEFTVCKDLSQIKQTVEAIFEYCKVHGISKDTANRMSVAVEEMIGNIFKYGGKRAGTVDVTMHAEDNVLHLKLTDDGIPFNPLEYKEDETEFDIHGIQVVKSISNHIEYMRVIDLNHTMISIENS